MCSLQVEDLSLAAMYSHVRWRDQESRGPLYGHVDGRSPAVAARQLLSVAAAQRGADVQQADLSHVVCRPVVAGKCTTVTCACYSLWNISMGSLQ